MASLASIKILQWSSFLYFSTRFPPLLRRTGGEKRKKRKKNNQGNSKIQENFTMQSDILEI